MSEQNDIIVMTFNLGKTLLFLSNCNINYICMSFSLHFLRLPIPRPGEVLGLVGTNGIGKSTALKILAGKQKPNLGRYNVGYQD